MLLASPVARKLPSPHEFIEAPDQIPVLLASLKLMSHLNFGSNTMMTEFLGRVRLVDFQMS